MELIWVVVGLAVVCLLVGAFLLRQADRRRTARAKANEQAAAANKATSYTPEDMFGSDPLQLKRNDIVDIPILAERGYRVTTHVRLADSDGYAWEEFRLELVDGTVRYLSVEKDGGKLSVILWREVPRREVEELQLHPDLSEFTYHDVAYRHKESGQAEYVVAGSDAENDLPDKQGVVYYSDFASKGGADHFSFESYGDRESFEASMGVEVPKGGLQIYPDPSAMLA